jgi:hypothetical protein
MGLRRLAQQDAPSLLDADIGAYQSPFQDQVIDLALGDIQRQQDIAQQRAQDQAIGAGAFGGSRSAILESEATRPFAEQAARTAANLRQAGFEQAQRAAESDIARQQAQQRFQAGLLGDERAAQFQSLGLLNRQGAQQRGLQQAALQAARGEFDRALQYGPQQFGLLRSGGPGLAAGEIQSSRAGGGNVLGGLLQTAILSSLLPGGGLFGGLSGGSSSGLAGGYDPLGIFS